ncbi:MAG: synthase gamma chain [Myxococcaceae bacterium]|nr:synthase gamma chain [Myxococcaceae bacterium]
MPSLKAIRRRITSVKSTQKITRAMKMVAAARLNRAQLRIKALRPYAVKTAEVLRSLAGRAGGDEEGAHQLLAQRPVKRVLLLVLTSDRGLAGAFNSSIQRAAERKIAELRGEGFEVLVGAIGRKGRDYLKRRGVEARHDWSGHGEPTAELASEIARTVSREFVEGEVDRVIVLFNEFKSAMTQKVTFLPLLPIETTAETMATATTASANAPAAGGRNNSDYIYEPSQAALLDRLLPMYVEVSVFRAMLDSSASEHGARMTAMDSATNNAKKMIGALTLEYNRARQAAITKELMEIIGGAEAIKD